jgi:dipeptidyl aminopeptidase/acylaminoacyl peptidase
MRPADLALMRIPAEPTVTPDGRAAVVAVTRLDLDADAYRSDLWLVRIDGAEAPRRLTHGPRDSVPRFSPDGRWLSFLRAEDGGKPQLHVMPVAGGEPNQVCAHLLGVTSPAWAPDSSRIAYCARVPEPGRYGIDPSIDPEKEPPRRIRTLAYRADGIGFVVDRRQQLFRVEVTGADAEPVQLTDGDADHDEPAWSPDGARVAVVAARHEGRDTDAVRDVFVVAAGGGELQRLTDTTLAAARPAFSPDGRTVWFAGHDGRDVAGRSMALWRVPADGSGAPERCTDPQRFDVDNLHARGELPLLVDDESVVTISQHRGAVELWRFPTGGGEPTRLVGGRRQVHGYARASGGAEDGQGGEVLVAAVADGTSAGELVALGADGERVLTDFGATLAAAAQPCPMEERTVHSPDGNEVHGWVVAPAGPGPFPVLLTVHGGPLTQYGYTLFDEAQVYAAAGYAVVLVNPRGSAGYGETHGRAVVHDVAAPAERDLLAFLDAALQDPRLDAGRVGVMGGSYGGLMTTWLAARHGGRFRAAISERSLNAPDSFLGSSDIGAWFIDAYLGAHPARVEAQSPLALADAIRIPTLIIHSEEDWRCPLEQAQRLFVALRRNGVDAELLLFPGEGHELSRSGLPSHRVARFEAILDWWARHL